MIILSLLRKAKPCLIIWLLVFTLLTECAPLPVRTQSEREKALGLLREYKHLKKHARDTPLGRRVGTALFQGDIRLSDAVVYETVEEALHLHSSRSHRAVTNVTSLLWTDATIPYIFDPMTPYSDEQKETLKQAMEMWEESTCIRFKPRENESFFVKFINLGWICFSSIGRQPDMENAGQDVNINGGCLQSKGVIAHELGHVIGFWHEHSRADRSNYIDILYENMVDGAADNFLEVPENDLDDLSTPYDFASIMHYALNIFSSNPKVLNTMRIKEGIEFTGEVGQRDSLSPLDIKQANLLYHCPTTSPPPLDSQDNSSAVNVSVVEEHEFEVAACQVRNALTTGVRIGLRSVTAARRMWMGCTDAGSCKLDGCPGNRFKTIKYAKCRKNIVHITKVGGANDKCLRVGDEVVLTVQDGESSPKKTITCGDGGEDCHLSDDCFRESGKFRRSDCDLHVIRLDIKGKQPGDVLKHKDTVKLAYLLDPASNQQLQCEMDNAKTCRRKVCHQRAGSAFLPPGVSGSKATLTTAAPTPSTSELQVTVSGESHTTLEPQVVSDEVRDELCDSTFVVYHLA